MRGAGGEVPTAALGRADAQDGGGDKHVGSTEKQEKECKGPVALLLCLSITTPPC